MEFGGRSLPSDFDNHAKHPRVCHSQVWGFLSVIDQCMFFENKTLNDDMDGYFLFLLME